MVAVLQTCQGKKLLLCAKFFNRKEHARSDTIYLVTASLANGHASSITEALVFFLFNSLIARPSASSILCPSWEAGLNVSTVIANHACFYIRAQLSCVLIRVIKRGQVPSYSTLSTCQPASHFQTRPCVTQDRAPSGNLHERMTSAAAHRSLHLVSRSTRLNLYGQPN